MNNSEIIKFLSENNIEPWPDNAYGTLYRTSAYLKDGTYLPCVAFQSKQKIVALAAKRFEELKKQPDQYKMVFESFVASGTCVDSYNIDRLEPSRFAWPLSLIKTIRGETVMSWTAFVVEMNDGKQFSYGTSFLFQFFDLPAGYGFQDIRKIHSGDVYSDSEGRQSFTMERHARVKYFREKPFFTCYIDGLETLSQ
jgi:hypothetical protein